MEMKGEYGLAVSREDAEAGMVTASSHQKFEFQGSFLVLEDQAAQVNAGHGLQLPRVEPRYGSLGRLRN